MQPYINEGPFNLLPSSHECAQTSYLYSHFILAIRMKLLILGRLVAWVGMILGCFVFMNMCTSFQSTSVFLRINIFTLSNTWPAKEE